MQTLAKTHHNHKQKHSTIIEFHLHLPSAMQVKAAELHKTKLVDTVFKTLNERGVQGGILTFEIGVFS